MQSSSSLAVKMRPHYLKDIYGQEAAKNLINGYIKRKSLPNTILITAEPGHGKTTLARIIANMVNDIKPGEQNSDCHESNLSAERGIDDMRSIMQTAKFLPKKNLRLIILDEVQGATPQAIQAALKILEEPPKATSFILCTTDPESLPKAVLSRSSRIVLHPYSVEDVIEMLTAIAKSEKLLVDLPAKARLQLFSDIAVNTGCVPRDAITLLDTASVLWDSGKYTSGKLVLKEALASGDVSNDQVAIKLMLCIYGNSIKSGIKTIRQATNSRSTLNTMLHLNQGLIDSLVDPKKWYSLVQNTFMGKLTENQIEAPLKTVMRVHKDLAEIKAKMYYGCDEANVMLGGICDIFLKANKSNG